MSDRAVAEGVVQLAQTHLRFLRRYARALTGSRGEGDALAVATLKSLLQDRDMLDMASHPAVGLFAAFHQIWCSWGAPIRPDETGPMGKAQQHMSAMTPKTREALLLHVVEAFSLPQVAEIMCISPEDAQDLLHKAQEQMQASVAGDVLIIEDEATIAMDLEQIVLGMGHRVSAVVRTRGDVAGLQFDRPPDLILSDIQLADGSSGVDAAADLTARIGPRPVLFVTAFPERYLTGQLGEPAFVIAKPYTVEQVRCAVSQAMFFASTETLCA